MDQTTFADVLQKSFIAMSMGSTDRITTVNILVNEIMAFLIGMFIFYIYKKTYQGVLYQRSFNISLVIACSVTALVIMTISGNLILSLGMVGAVSIVRFRTPIKDSMDLIFLFWAIAGGIASGVGYFNIAIIGSVLIAVFLLLLTRTKTSEENSYLLVLQCSTTEAEQLAIQKITKHADRIAIKSKTLFDSNSEVTLEIKLSENNTDFLNELPGLDGVTRVTMVAYEQDMAQT